MRLVLLVLLVLLSASAIGCAGTAPPAAIPSPPPAAVELPRPEPILVEVEVAVQDVAPVTPPEARKLRIDRRAISEEAQSVEWTLANGLTVVYVRGEGTSGYHARIASPTGWGSLPPTLAARYAALGGAEWGPLEARIGPHGRVAMGEVASLAELVEAVAAVFTTAPDRASPAGPLAALAPLSGMLDPPDLPADEARELVASAFDRPDGFRVFLFGGVAWEWVEPVVADLAVLRPRDSAFGPILDDPPGRRGDTVLAGEESGRVVEVEADAGWSDLPAAWILERALADRVGGGVKVRLRVDADGGRLRLRATGPAVPADLLAPLSEDAILRARSEAVRAAASPPGRLDAFAALYDLPGTYRPARRPVEAARLGGAIARTPPDRVVDLLRRLAASPDAASVTLAP